MIQSIKKRLMNQKVNVNNSELVFWESKNNHQVHHEQVSFKPNRSLLSNENRDISDMTGTGLKQVLKPRYRDYLESKIEIEREKQSKSKTKSKLGLQLDSQSDIKSRLWGKPRMRKRVIAGWLKDIPEKHQADLLPYTRGIYDQANDECSAGGFQCNDSYVNHYNKVPHFSCSSKIHNLSKEEREERTRPQLTIKCENGKAYSSMDNVSLASPLQVSK